MDEGVGHNRRRHAEDDTNRQNKGCQNYFYTNMSASN